MAMNVVMGVVKAVVLDVAMDVVMDVVLVAVMDVVMTVAMAASQLAQAHSFATKRFQTRPNIFERAQTFTNASQSCRVPWTESC